MDGLMIAAVATGKCLLTAANNTLVVDQRGQRLKQRDVDTIICDV